MKLEGKTAFSLAEALMLLLVSSLVVIATMPLITIKHIKLPDRAPHGKWACKLINGQMHSATAANVNQKLPPDSKWKKGCTFPELPASVSYIIVQAIGGGSAGQQGDFHIGLDNKTDDLFPSGKDQSVYTVEETSKYKIYFPGESGRTGTLSPSFFDVILNGFKYMSCAFNTASPNELVPYVTFEYDLKRGDQLILSSQEIDVENKLNNYADSLCDASKSVLAQWIDQDGASHTEWYKFQSVQHKPGSNGNLRTLSVKTSSGIKDLVKIKGSGGGYYVSSTDSCSIDCSKRFLRNYDRASWPIEKYIETPGITDYEKGFSSNKKAKITSQGNTLSYYGGCGGAAGQVNTVLMEKPEKTNIQIKIGKGGVPTLNEGHGEDTMFDFIIASGGIGCADNSLNTSVNGTKGGKANTMAALDSVAGAGGKGKVGSPIPSTDDMKGENASGLGSGGGGGGFALNINKPLDDYTKNNLIYQLEDYKVFGEGGKGASGGIIVSW